MYRLLLRATVPALAASVLLAGIAAAIPSDGTWSRLPITRPVHYHSVVVDAVHQRLITFGGSQNGANSNDVFVLDLTGPLSWNRIDPVGARPEPRNGQAAIYDPVRDRLIV